MAAKTKSVLHVGCGGDAPGKLHAAFGGADWTEIRLDIDPDVRPDIVASMTDMAPVADASVDAVFSSHNLEHLYPHEVPVALREFRRVLAPGGLALITMPDMEAIAGSIASTGLTEAAYMSPLGPITPMDMLYGFGPALARGNHFMAHRGGFTGRSLMASLSQAGFVYSVVQRNPPAFALWAIAFAQQPEDSVAEAAKQAMLPLHIAARARELASSP